MHRGWSRWTGDAQYGDVARRAILAILESRGDDTGLGPSGLNVLDGSPTLPIAQIGGGVDSWYEYLCKGASLFADGELADTYAEVRSPVHQLLEVHQLLGEETAEGLH